MRTEAVSVECYSGFKSNERPRAFVFRGKRHEIREILDRWYEGTADPRIPWVNYFKVRTEGGEEYLLGYHGLFDRWSILLPDEQRDGGNRP